ncbi:hypothetical protein JCM10296v2_001564 [Rhodotorula toruloides]
MPEFYDADQVAAQWRALLAVCPNVKALTVLSLELASVLAQLRKWPLRVHSVEGAFTDAMLDFLADQQECMNILLMADPDCLSTEPRPKPCCGIKELTLSDAWLEISEVMLKHVTVPSAATLSSLMIDINPDAPA